MFLALSGKNKIQNQRDEYFYNSEADFKPIARRKYLALSIIAPLIIIYFLKLLFNAFPAQCSDNKFYHPELLIVHFLSFLLCAILLVQERTRGTLERMLISGYHRTSIIGGYTLGYLGLATTGGSSIF